jgi:hypothetical protein
MTITRNITAIILLVMAAIALAIGVTIARVIVNHNGVVTTTSVSGPSAVHNIGYDM